jgi:hypothetical protein
MSNETVTIPSAMWKDALVQIDKLKAENERLRSASFVTAVPSEQYEKLKAENERLREAGAAMYDTAVQDSMGLWLMPAFKRWAKVENEKIQ